MSKENKLMKQIDLIHKLEEIKVIVEDCLTSLSPQISSGKRIKKGSPTTFSLHKLDFGLTERNFIKTYAKNLSGSKKFTLLLAYLAKGTHNAPSNLSEIKKHWSKMKAKNLMGYAFNRYYATEAKTQGWVDTNKHGSYFLKKDWTKIFRR